MLGEHNITYRPWTSVKGQILADFLVEKPDDAPLEASAFGLILTIPEGTEFTYALRFQFAASNNEAECEALIAGLWIMTRMGVRNIQKEVAAVVDEEGPTWMTPIIEYLRDETLPDDRKEASKLRIKARQYELLEGILYRRSFLKPWLRATIFSRQGPGKVKFLIVAMDYFTKWIKAKAVAKISGSQVKKFVWDNIVCHFGLLREIVSDNGKQFSDDPFEDWCEKLNIVQHFASVKHPQSNGLVERAHRTMIKSSNNDTPFSLTCGMEAVIPAEIEMPTYSTAVVDVVHNDEELRLNLNLLEERRERTTICEGQIFSRTRNIAF
ncbi:reverse transcriptase domain-containing protein [Tanacetum coccineum]